ncbi:hypothetical protein Tco_0094137, partial [Tanacetum coccineum]
RHLKGSHWSSRDKNDTIEAKKHTLMWDFTLKPLVKKHKPLTHGLSRWQSVCSHFDPTNTRWELMIGSKQGPGLIGAFNRPGDLDSSFSAINTSISSLTKSSRSSYRESSFS